MAARERSSYLSARTRRGLDSIADEFTVFLAGMADSERGSWAGCTDLDVYVFLEAYYLPRHEGKYGGDVAPSTLRRAVSSLRTAFERACRSGPWTVAAGGRLCFGNPASSAVISELLDMYARSAQEVGYCEVSARPLQAADLALLLAGLADEAARARVLCDDRSHQLLCRDSAFFSCLWSTCRRGQDVLRVEWSGIFDAADETLIAPAWLSAARAGSALALPVCLLVVPMSTKTEKGRRPGTLVVPATGDAACPVAALARLLAASVRLGWPAAGLGPVFSGFSARDSVAVSSTAMAARLVRAAGVHSLSGAAAASGLKAYTLHSFRRGRLQYEHARGMSHDQLRSLAGIKTEEVLMRYLDTGRHLARLPAGLPGNV